MGPAINLRRLKAILQAANEETASVPSAKLVNTVRDRLLWTSVITMSAFAIAIVFLMTVKLALIGSLITFAIVIVVGLIASTVILKNTAPAR